MIDRLLTMLRDVRGATAIEYGLVAALIAVGSIAAMQGLGNGVKHTFSDVQSNLPAS